MTPVFDGTPLPADAGPGSYHAGYETISENPVRSSGDFPNVECVPCFTPDTLIATPKGARRVQTLRAGDRILTRDNGLQEIQWLGTRPLGHRDLTEVPHLRPVSICAGALGNGLPERDMVVSPNHRMLVANDRTSLYFEDREVLVHARHLTGRAGIELLPASNVTYIHFMFRQHEIILSNGAWSESFQPTEYTLQGIGEAHRSQITGLFPDLKTREGWNTYQAARRSLGKHETVLLG